MTTTTEPPEGPEIERMRAAVKAQLFKRPPSLHDDDVVAERYRVGPRIGSGNMASVHRAHDLRDDAVVALKLLRSRDVLGGTGLARMRREAALLAKLDHPNLVRVLDSGEYKNGAYVAMELIEGEPLAKLMQREGAIPWPRARELLLQIADGLASAHAAGVMHRDLKPANILVGGRKDAPTCKVIDFGLARPLGVDPDTGKLTGTGLVFGTPRYMSPEQVRGIDVDMRADVYAFGCLAYELLTGVPAMRADAVGEVLVQHLSEHPLPFAEVAQGLDLPAGVEALVRKATRKDRTLRFAAMDEVRAALLAIDRGDVVEVPDEDLQPLSQPSRAQSRGRVLAAMLALVGAAAATTWAVLP
jgi:serine/threonine-protein kinase